MPRSVAETLELPDEDYWLLDSRRVALMAYDDRGNWLSVDFIDEPDLVARYAAGRDAAIDHGTPLNAYLKEIDRAERAL